LSHSAICLWTAYRGHTATISPGETLLVDGVTYTTLSGAARFHQGGVAVAGWNFWCVEPELTRAIADIRAALVTAAE